MVNSVNIDLIIECNGNSCTGDKPYCIAINNVDECVGKSFHEYLRLAYKPQCFTFDYNASSFFYVTTLFLGCKSDANCTIDTSKPFCSDSHECVGMNILLLTKF